jgi:hypothetical protein
MSLLVNLNQEGYLSIKNDRNKIKQKINDLSNEVINLQYEIKKLQSILLEFNTANERLKDFYEPQIEIKQIKFFKGEYYQGITKFQYPVPSELKVKLGKVSSFKGIKDKSLIDLAEKMMKEKIKKEFPLYF